MATHPISPKPDEPRSLTREEAYELLRSLAGSMEGWFPAEGGASEVLRQERQAWPA